MGRIRTVKPEFFKHSGLFDLEQETGLPIRLAFAGLWTCADRAGRFKWRPRELKIDVLPYDDCDFSRVLDALASRGFIVRYTSEAQVFGFIPTWKEHQFINNKEAQSLLPDPLQNQQLDASITREGHDEHASDTRGVKEGNGMEGNGREGETAREPRPPQAVPIRIAEPTEPDWATDEEAGIPDDLPCAPMGAFLLQRLSIPHSYGLAVKFADAVDLLARDESLARGDAARTLLERARDAPSGTKWTFWLQDGGWKQAQTAGVSTEGWE
jgi:hypothetical protein